MTALAIAALSASWVFAANDARSSIHVTANIPNKQFHVQPRNPDFGKDEYMNYNPVSYELSSIRQTFDVKNTDGSVHAYLDGRSILSNGVVLIPLRVWFNDVLLDEMPREVVDDAASTPGPRWRCSSMPIIGPFLVILACTPGTSLSSSMRCLV